MGILSEAFETILLSSYFSFSTRYFDNHYYNFRNDSLNSFSDLNEKDAQNVLSRIQAISFLRKQSKTLHRSRRSTVNPYEECCIEGCTLKEISEYDCY